MHEKGSPRQTHLNLPNTRVSAEAFTWAWKWTRQEPIRGGAVINQRADCGHALPDAAQDANKSVMQLHRRILEQDKVV